MIDEIRGLYAYNRWANERILDACQALAPEQLGKGLGSSFSSVRETLAHIFAAEWIWLSRWNGVSPRGMPAWELPDVASLRARWDEVEAERADFLSRQDDASLRKIVAYRNTKGEPFQSPLWQLLRHVANHSTYHRGQVVTMLRQLGAAAPSTDLVLFYREGGRD